MTKEEMLEGLFSDETVKNSLLAMSGFGALTDDTVSTAIPQYYSTCGVLCHRLLEMNVQKKSPFTGSDNNNVPFIVIGNLGNIEGAAEDMIAFLCTKEKISDEEFENYANGQIAAGDAGEPNLIHGIMTTDTVGAYLNALKVNLMMAALDHEINHNPMADDVPDIFAGKVH